MMEKNSLIILCVTAGIISIVIMMGPVYLEYVDKSFDLKEQQFHFEYQQIFDRLQNLEENYKDLKEKQLKDVTSAEFDELRNYIEDLEEFTEDEIIRLETTNNNEFKNIKDDLIAIKIYLGWFNNLKKTCAATDGSLSYSCFETYILSEESPEGFEFKPEPPNHE